MVGAAPRRLPCPGRIRRLLDVGGPAGKSLPMGTLSVTDVRARAVRRSRTLMVRPEAGMVAGLAHLLARGAHSLDPRRFPPDVLLLPRSLLQGILGRSALLHGGRASPRLPG